MIAIHRSYYSQRQFSLFYNLSSSPLTFIYKLSVSRSKNQKMLSHRH